MTVGILQVEIRFPEPQSLKEKRVLLKGMLDRIRNRFNVAVAEIDGMDLWQKSVLAIAAVARERVRVNQTLDYIMDFFRSERHIEIINQQMELL